jgi:hypothetical protein
VRQKLVPASRGHPSCHRSRSHVLPTERRTCGRWVRGLLCPGCNGVLSEVEPTGPRRAVGSYTGAWLERAIAYLAAAGCDLTDPARVQWARQEPERRRGSCDPRAVALDTTSREHRSKRPAGGAVPVAVHPGQEAGCASPAVQPLASSDGWSVKRAPRHQLGARSPTNGSGPPQPGRTVVTTVGFSRGAEVQSRNRLPARTQNPAAESLDLGVRSDASGRDRWRFDRLTVPLRARALPRVIGPS